MTPIFFIFAFPLPPTLIYSQTLKIYIYDTLKILSDVLFIQVVYIHNSKLIQISKMKIKSVYNPTSQREPLLAFWCVLPN